MEFGFRVAAGSNASDESVVTEQLHAVAVVNAIRARRRTEEDVRIFQAVEEAGNDAEGLSEGRGVFDFFVVVVVAGVPI